VQPHFGRTEIVAGSQVQHGGTLVSAASIKSVIIVGEVIGHRIDFELDVQLIDRHDCHTAVNHMLRGLRDSIAAVIIDAVNELVVFVDRISVGDFKAQVFDRAVAQAGFQALQVDLAGVDRTENITAALPAHKLADDVSWSRRCCNRQTRNRAGF